jgi:hypothetical protein
MDSRYHIAGVALIAKGAAGSRIAVNDGGRRLRDQGVVSRGVFLMHVRHDVGTKIQAHTEPRWRVKSPRSHRASAHLLRG